MTSQFSCIAARAGSSTASSPASVSTRGDRIAYDDSGPADAPAVVFIAGAGPDRAGDPTTRATAELLAAQGIRSLFADRFGRGESVSNGPITLDAQLAAIAATAASAPLVALTATETFPGMIATADALAAAAATGHSERMPGSDHAWNADAMAQRLADFVHPLGVRTDW